jgi:spermidine/putrescine transport system permease protein
MKKFIAILSRSYAWLILLILYFPVLAIGLASFAKKRYLRFPITEFTTRWYGKAMQSGTVAELVSSSLLIAATVTVIAVIIGFFAALAYARYEWKGRRLFQKLVLLPIFFPQSVLGLALLMWFNFLGVVPSWKTAVVAHVMWISPIVTLIIAIQAYSLDPSIEEAASDFGASRWQVLTRITLPLLSQSMVSAGLFAFLLSWGNFALSLFTTGADSTLPEWLYAKMVSGYTPLIPAVGTLAVTAAITLIAVCFGVAAYRRGYQCRICTDPGLAHIVKERNINLT